MARKFRIAVVNSHPIQYFAPLYRYLHASGDFEVTALYCSDHSLRGGLDAGFNQPVKWDVDLLSGYKSAFLGVRAKTRTPAGFWSLVCPELVHELTPEKYDAVVVHGTQFASYVLATVIAKMRGIPVFNRCETQLRLARSPARRRARNVVLASLYRRLDAFLAIGSANRRYYESLGVAPSRIFVVPYTIDNERFAASARVSEEERRALRSGLGLKPDLPVILYASKLQRRKHPDTVLRAVAALQREGLACQALLVGSGEMYDELRRLRDELCIENVSFAGFVNQAELPKLFGLSDVFVLPAENEPWGLIVNEVMCAGLPVVVGSEVGCVEDLVRDGETGILVRAGSVDDVRDAIRKLLMDPEGRRSMGERARGLIGSWDYEACRRGLLEACDAVLGARSHRGTRPT